jgi:hypothetical protein
MFHATNLIFSAKYININFTKYLELIAHMLLAKNIKYYFLITQEQDLPALHLYHKRQRHYTIPQRSIKEEEIIEEDAEDLTDRDGTNPIEEKVVAAKTTRRIPPTTIGDQGLTKPKNEDKAVEEDEDLEDKTEVG